MTENKKNGTKATRPRCGHDLYTLLKFLADGLTDVILKQNENIYGAIYITMSPSSFVYVTVGFFVIS